MHLWGTYRLWEFIRFRNSLAVAPKRSGNLLILPRVTSMEIQLNYLSRKAFAIFFNIESTSESIVGKFPATTSSRVDRGVF